MNGQGAGGEAGPGMAGGGNDGIAGNALGACVDGSAGKAGRDSGDSGPAVGSVKSWANARRRRRFDDWGVVLALAGGPRYAQRGPPEGIGNLAPRTEMVFSDIGGLPIRTRFQEDRARAWALCKVASSWPDSAIRTSMR